MATIYRQGRKWRAQVYVEGVRDSAVRPTKAEAAAWALAREAALTGRRLPDKTLGDALREYSDKVTPGHRGAKWERVRLRAFGLEPLAKYRLAGLVAEDFARWRDDRLKAKRVRKDGTSAPPVKPGTVAREMNLLRSVLEHARRDWHWIRTNPMADVSWPKTPGGRRRRITPEEVTAVRLAFGVGKDYRGETARQRVGLAFLFALETAMRSGEICGLTWDRVSLASQFVTLPLTKNGDAREVPLSQAACAILRALPSKEGSVFQLEDRSRDVFWRRHRPVADLHFHDSRAEAIWRLSKKLDVLQLAQVVGQRDLKSLMRYYRASASELAMRLG